VFDPDTVADLATYEEPTRHPIGIQQVVVNGRVAVDGGAETDARSGRLIRRGT
jgi:N-acyl-D-aspartate/D-glutamate deacylase